MKSVALKSSYWLDHPVPCHVDDVPIFRKILKGTSCMQIALQEVKPHQLLILKYRILSWKIVFDTNSKRYCLAYVMKDDGKNMHTPYFYRIIAKDNNWVDFEGLIVKLQLWDKFRRAELLNRIGYTKIFHIQAINR